MLSPGIFAYVDALDENFCLEISFAFWFCIWKEELELKMTKIATFGWCFVWLIIF